MFSGRKFLIATKHDKEKAIGPILEKEFGIHFFVNDQFDSDLLGTFTGEIERTDDPITTARKKCLQAMAMSDCDLAIASEGSFGPHPNIGFVPADEEWLLLIDQKNELEILVREISTNTNFNVSLVKHIPELKKFANDVGFPSHGLIVRKDKNDFSTITKGITDWETLLTIADNHIEKFGQAYIETDMRAMYNPTRMKVIEQATIKLAKKMKALCPVCQMPGFGIINQKSGLPCAVCHTPTPSTFAFVFGCAKCNHQQDEYFPHNKKVEDPMFCPNCNP